MRSCKEVSELVSQSLDRRLSPRERLGVHLHLLVCRLCRRYRRQILFLSHATRRLRARGPQLSPEARRRILQRIRERLEEQDGPPDSR